MIQVKKFCLENGLYCDMHWHTILVIPPLIINEQQLAEGFAVLDKALEITDRAARG
jgi:taurine--2-oxoglutarate transaminase